MNVQMSCPVLDSMYVCMYVYLTATNFALQMGFKMEYLTSDNSR